MDKITFKQFKTNLIAQPFFIWHSLDKAENDDLDFESFWDTDVDYAETDVQQVMMQTFSKVHKELENILLKNEAIVLSGSLEERIEKTKEYIGTDIIVINPVFEYRDAIAKPFAFDFKEKIVINLKYSKKTKRMDFMHAYYDVSIISKTLKVNDYNLYLPMDIAGLKGEINLTCVNHINLGKSGGVYNDVDKKGNLKSINVMEKITGKSKLDETKEVSKKKVSKKNDFIIKDIDLYIDEINNARDVNQISESLYFDSTIFGDNPFWDELLEANEHKYHGFSGNIITKKNIIEDEEITNNVFQKYQEIDQDAITDKKRVIEFLDNIHLSKKVIWYDFEGFSLPFPAVDHTKAFQQIVFQLSKIETNSNVEELQKQNLIWDPTNIGPKEMYEIIYHVYSNKADKYIVYNKGYENSRLREMVLLLQGTEYYDEATEMFAHIDDNTLDLWELFKVTRGGSNVPAILLSDQKCKSSIKNIEKHISANNINLPYSIKEYKNLDVKNGSMAMDVAIKRAIGVMGDSQWAEKVEQLKEYCENDVRMMIMVYHFIKYLIWKGKTWEKEEEEVDIQNNTAQ